MTATILFTLLALIIVAGLVRDHKVKKARQQARQSMTADEREADIAAQVADEENRRHELGW